MTGRATAGRIAVAVGSLTLGLLVVEGGLSLGGARTLRERLDGPEIPRSRAPTDEQRAAEGDRGPWRVHEDPLVGFTFRTGSRLELIDGQVATDNLGLRRRAGPPEQESALRVLVMGDSVAFGFGVDDDETLAHHLEQQLAAAATAGARQVVCRTVAVPGWNHRNAAAFLRDHWDELRPDIVLYLPINNDLANTYSVWENGRRRDAPDIATPDPWLRVSTDQTHFGALELSRRLAAEGRAGETEVEDLGPQVLTADLSPESRRRYDENVDSIAWLAERLSRQGGRLLLLQYTEGTYEWMLLSRLVERGLDVPVLPLLVHVPKEFTLESDPHPTAATHAVFGLWSAQALVERGWVPGRRLEAFPEAPPAYRELRAQPREPQAWQQRADEERSRLRAQLRERIDVASGHGLYQVYGGLNPDGTGRYHLLALLPRGGDQLQLELQPLAQRKDLYPLEVAVDVDGQHVHTLHMAAEGTTTASIALPPATGAAPIEVRLRAAHVVVTTWEGRSQLSAYHLSSLACPSR